MSNAPKRYKLLSLEILEHLGLFEISILRFRNCPTPLPYVLDKFHDDQANQEEQVKAQETQGDSCHRRHLYARHNTPHVFSCSGCIRSL